MRLLAVLPILLLCAPAHCAPLTSIPASDPRIRWVGRTLVNSSDGSVSLDWEGTSASVTLSNATYAAVLITDKTSGGARIAVYANNVNQSVALAGDPNPSSNATPDLKVAMWPTSPLQALYSLSRGSGGEVVTYTLVLLTEASFIGDDSATSTLTLHSLVTDGVLLPFNASSRRRMDVYGDSLTAGYGSGFDAPASGAPCGAGVMINDVTNDYSWMLCSDFNSDCHVQAVSGVTLFAATPNLPQIVNYTLGSMLRWDANDSVLWDYASYVPDAVIINLGENDWHAANGKPTPAFIAEFVQRYVQFVTLLNTRYGPGANVTYFLTIAPHEAGQSVGVVQVPPLLQAVGIRALFLNATVDESLLPRGCGGHPGPTIHAAAAARAQPFIAAAMGW